MVTVTCSMAMETEWNAMTDFSANINATVRRIAELTRQWEFQDAGYTYQGETYLTIQFVSHKTRELPAQIGYREAFGFNQQTRNLVKIQMDVWDLPDDLSEEVLKGPVTLAEDGELFGKEQGWKLVGQKILGKGQLELWFEG